MTHGAVGIMDVRIVRHPRAVGGVTVRGVVGRAAGGAYG